MRTRKIAIGLLLFLIGATASAIAAREKAADAAAGFARLKSLVGEWKTDDGKHTLTYELVAGGTVVLERETSSGGQTMLTLYHRDGDRFMLTHYCMEGNQPRMVARTFDPKIAELSFEFLDATNLASPGAAHMHNLKFRFVDDNHFENEWQFYENGKATVTGRARYARVR